MSYPSSNGSGPLTAIEATGTYWLLQDKNKCAWLGINGRKNAYPIFTDYVYSQRKIKSGQWSLVAADVKGGVRKIVEQNSKNKSLRVPRLDRQFKSFLSLSIYKAKPYKNTVSGGILNMD